MYASLIVSYFTFGEFLLHTCKRQKNPLQYLSTSALSIVALMDVAPWHLLSVNSVPARQRSNLSFKSFQRRC